MMKNEELWYPLRDDISIIFVRKYHNYSIFIFHYVLIGFIQQGPKSVIPRSEATWESPGTAYKSATFYQEIATP